MTDAGEGYWKSGPKILEEIHEGLDDWYKQKEEFRERLSNSRRGYPASLLEKLIIVNGATIVTSLTLVGYLLNSTADHYLSAKQFEKVEWAWLLLIISFTLCVLGMLDLHLKSSMDVLRAKQDKLNHRVERLAKLTSKLDTLWRKDVIGGGLYDHDDHNRGIESSTILEDDPKKERDGFGPFLAGLCHIGPLPCTMAAWMLLFSFAGHSIPLK